MLILTYRDTVIATMNNEDELPLILNRPMFINITKEQTNNLHTGDETEIFTDNYLYRLIIIGKDIIITNIEYNILKSLYNNSESINTKYTLYQYIFTHPIFTIPDIDQYIKYRDELYKISILDREYEFNVMNRLI